VPVMRSRLYTAARPAQAGSKQCQCRLAEACVPIQDYDPGYDPATALARGTMFPSLWRPEFVVPCISYSRYAATRFRGGFCR